MDYQVKYRCRGKEYVNNSPFAEVKLVSESDRMRLTIIPKEEIQMVSAVISLDDKLENGEKFFSEGFQSWTDTMEMSYEQSTKKMGFLGRLKFLDKKYGFTAYGDYNFIPYRTHYSFDFTYLRHLESCRFYGSITERNGYTIFFLDGRNLKATKDIAGIYISSAYELFNILVVKGTKDEVFDKYAAAIGGQLRTKKKIKGFTTWYRYYENITASALEEDVDKIKQKNLDIEYIQLDDGFETQAGDWTSLIKEKFPDGLEPVVKKIKEAGYKPGLWLAPFAAGKDSELAAKHPDWLVKDATGKPLLAGANWGTFYALDLEKEEVKEYIHSFLDFYKKMGFVLFKLDFLYAAGLIPTRTKTRGQLMTEAMEFLRKELDDVLVLGCGVPMFQAFFNVDYCRIGMDVTPEFNSKFLFRHLHRETPSTKFAIGNIIARAPFDSRFFMNDPDVIFFADDKMTPEQMDLLYQADQKYGSLFFTSDDVSKWTENDITKWNGLGK